MIKVRTIQVMHTRRSSDFVECTSSGLQQDVAQHIKINFSDKNTACFLSPYTIFTKFQFILFIWSFWACWMISQQQPCFKKQTKMQFWKFSEQDVTTAQWVQRNSVLSTFRRGLRNVCLLIERNCVLDGDFCKPLIPLGWALSGWLERWRLAGSWRKVVRRLGFCRPLGPLAQPVCRPHSRPRIWTCSRDALGCKKKM